MVEVLRPDGILCVMAGKPYPADDPPDGYAGSMNEEKERTLAAGQQGLRARLEAQELEGLADRLGPPWGPGRSRAGDFFSWACREPPRGSDSWVEPGLATWPPPRS
jgi:hypothetical protein